MFESSPIHDGPTIRPRTALVAPVVGWAAGAGVALVATMLVQSLVGRATPFTATVGLALVSGGFVAGALAFTRRDARLDAADVGLGRAEPAVTAAWAAVIACPALAIAAAGLAGEPLAEALPAPAAVAGIAPPLPFGAEPPAIPLSAAVVTGALALAVLPAIATEVVARGIVLTSLARGVGVVPAVAVAAVLTPAPFAVLLGGEAPPPVVAAALAGGVALSLSYLRTGTAYPGIATLALGLGLAFGLSLGWSPAPAAALALTAAVTAVALAAWLAALWDGGLGRSPYGARGTLVPSVPRGARG
jgi:hypothetical protein